LVWTKQAGLLPSVHQANDRVFGAVLFPVSLTLCAACYWPIDPLIFQGAALILGLSDGLAGLIGQKMGRRPYRITGPKTIEGSFVFFIVTVTIFLILSGEKPGLINPIGLFVMAIAALLLTAVEGSLGKGWDNLPIPILGGLILLFLLS
jgi:phytol kinase